MYRIKGMPGYEAWFEKVKGTSKYKRWVKGVNEKRVSNRRANHGGHWGRTGRPANTPEVLWSKVDRGDPNECWPWMGYINKGGYGRTWINNKGYYAHRVIYNLYHTGKLPFDAPADKLGHGFLRHTCDNPRCCNPAHLALGTLLDNAKDKVERGRQKRWNSVDSPRAKLTREQVIELRLQKASGVSTKELMKQYGVSKPTVNQIVSRKYYKDIP